VPSLISLAVDAREESFRAVLSCKEIRFDFPKLNKDANGLRLVCNALNAASLCSESTKVKPFVGD